MLANKKEVRLRGYLEWNVDGTVRPYVGGECGIGTCRRGYDRESPGRIGWLGASIFLGCQYYSVSWVES